MDMVWEVGMVQTVSVNRMDSEDRTADMVLQNFDYGVDNRNWNYNSYFIPPFRL